jgi:hypothetical protein
LRKFAFVGATESPRTVRNGGIFDLRPAASLAAACRIANRQLTRAEWQRYVGKGFRYQGSCI